MVVLLSSSRAFRNAGQQRAALAASSVLVVAPERVAEAIVADLLATGVGQARAISDPTPADIRAVGLVATLDSQDALAQVCRRYGVPPLRFALHGGRIEIGPLFYGDDLACYECFAAGHRSYPWPAPIRRLAPRASSRG